jgi:hypothetical protein
MLKIRPEQLAAMVGHKREELASVLLSRLRASHPELIASVEPERAKALVRDAIERAGRFGFTTRPVIERYVVLFLAHGAGFDEPRHVQRVLLDATAGEEERIGNAEELFR